MSDNDLDAIRRRMHNCHSPGEWGRASAERQPSRAISRISISSAPWGWNGGCKRSDRIYPAEKWPGLPFAVIPLCPGEAAHRVKDLNFRISLYLAAGPDPEERAGIANAGDAW